jgi:hypothetical protein
MDLLTRLWLKAALAGAPDALRYQFVCGSPRHSPTVIEVPYPRDNIRSSVHAVKLYTVCSWMSWSIMMKSAGYPAVTLTVANCSLMASFEFWIRDGLSLM